MKSRPHNNLLAAVGARIAELRDDRRLTQEQLANKLKIALRNYQSMESGKRNLTLLNIDKIAKALGVDGRFLFGGAPATGHKSTARILPIVSANAPPKAIPVVSLRAAAGILRDPRSVDVDGWTLVESPPNRPCFVAQVRGHSMEPKIPDGAWCLFQSPPADDEKGRIVLVQHSGKGSPDDGGSYLLKRWGGVSRKKGMFEVRLESLNKATPVMTLTATSAQDIRVIAEWVRVLAP